MGGHESADHPKSLADILAEELGDAASEPGGQDEPLEAKQARLKEVYARIRALEPGRSALCFSGGGIRSATFGLGVLQEMARRGLLEQFDFLSTVSGGGYVGGWLTAWIKNHQAGRAGVLKELQTRPEKTLLPEPRPIRHLRAYSNYLTPHVGFLSADMWTMVATCLRNMVLNWLILLSWLAAAMMIPRFCLALLPFQPGDGLLDITLGLGMGGIAVAMAYAVLDLPSAGRTNWSQRRFFLWRQLPLFFSAACLAEWWNGFCSLHGRDDARILKTPYGIPFFAAFMVLAYLAGGLLAKIAPWILKSARARLPSRQRFMQSMVAVLTAMAGGAALWVVAAGLFPDPVADARRYVCLATPLILGVFMLVNFLFAGLASRISADADREWWGRSAGWLLITGLCWLVSASVVIFGPFVFAWQDAAAKALLGAAGGLSGVVAAVFGFSATSAAKRSQQATLGTRLIPVAAAAIFFLFLSLGISRVLDGRTALSANVGAIYAHKTYLAANPQPGVASPPPPLAEVPGWTMDYRRRVFADLWFTIGMLLAGIGLGAFIDVNKFSLHAAYRNRLIRAYLGASRGGRQPHQFTGFDPQDDFPMSELSREKPFHVVNMALNLVRGESLAWQERKAESFTVSRLHAGGWRTGYRPSERYGGGISLGTALAISGAAASPNMGYHSSPIVGFLMTLFNLRLGWWLGNPGGTAWEKAGPSYAVGPLFAEASGNTTDTYKYVNLSDGGHFENLGLYEMVLRRCRFIVAVDAGCDTEYVFEDLGNALRKIRIDFGVPIDLKVSSPKVQKGEIHHCAFGRIRYSEVDGPGTDGLLVYIKPVLSGDEPADVANYASAHPEFPHEGTGNQWFSESQLESYRSLGVHAIESICGENWEAKPLRAFFEQVEEQVRAETAEDERRQARG